jgi:hypothetical protein
MLAQCGPALRVLRARSDQRAALSARPEILAGIEAEPGHLAQGPGRAPLVRGPDGLGGVFNEREVVPAADLEAFVLGVIAFSRSLGSRFIVSFSMSTYTGFAPV